MSLRFLSILTNLLFVYGVFFFAFFLSDSVAGLDFPHDGANSVGCLTCHDMMAVDQPMLIPQNGHIPQDIDDTVFNNVCWGCHNGADAFKVKTHSSLQSDNEYGDWTVECWVCHNQHTQEQNNSFGTAYGKYVRSRIYLSRISGVMKTGTRIVKFTNNTGANSFADGDATSDGICEVCHTMTSHWSPAAPEGDDHYPGKNCMNCHNHGNGFIHGEGGGAICGDCHNSGDHVIHLTRGKTCAQCHGEEAIVDINGDVQFADGKPLVDTNVCTTCHYTKPGWGATATACLSCHHVSQGSRAAIGQQLQGNSHHIQGVQADDYHCYECHWEARKVDGVVTGKIDIDYHSGESQSGAAVDLVVYGAWLRPDTYQVGATAIQYTADGSRTELEKLNNHCLGCHSNKNNTMQPFGDGKTPREYAWDGSSVDAKYSDTGTTAWGKYSVSSRRDLLTKAFSAHGNAPANQGGSSITKYNGFVEAESWADTRGGSVRVVCADCHNSHGSNVSGTTASYVSATPNGALLKNTVAGKGGYSMDYAPVSGGSGVARNQYNAGADLCFDCHLTENGGQVPWGYKATYGAAEPVRGFSDYNRFGADGDIRNTHAGGHFGPSQPLSVAASGSINGLCTSCHDPHGVSSSFNQNYGVPLLKGTWLASPYRLDSPKASAGKGAGGGMGGTWTNPPLYTIDQNTFALWNFTSTAGISESTDAFGGLCLRCHPKSSIDPDSTGAWKTTDRVHETVRGWGANNKHAFPCSKCHTPHATERLPRLMITNCLNSKHKGRQKNNLAPDVLMSYSTDSAGPGNTEHRGGNGRYAAGGQGSNGTVGFGLGINCHDSIGTGTFPDKNLWNNVTPWLDQDNDESYYYTSNPTSPIGDCDDTDAGIYRAQDRTCDGDGDGFIDATAGGNDCDDANNAVGYVPGVCDKDGDNLIDTSFGGYDCDDYNAAIGIADDGICDNDGDGGIDWTAGGTDCADNNPGSNQLAADGTCDGDSDGLIDLSAGGTDCDDDNQWVIDAPDGTCDGDGDGIVDTGARSNSDAGLDCDDDDDNIGSAVDGTCDGDKDTYIDMTAGGTDCNDSNAAVRSAPDGTCDGDGDGRIDAAANPTSDTGLDCDDNDPVIRNPTDGNCDSDNDGYIDSTAFGPDCNDLNAAIAAAADGSCDGDTDGLYDMTAGGTDCDDTAAGITAAPDLTCDGDSDGHIDWQAGGDDCQDGNTGFFAADGTCDGDQDSLIDMTAGGTDCDDSNSNVKVAADATCDGDSDGFIDPSAGGTDCDDDNNALGYMPEACDVDGDTFVALSYGGIDCLDTDSAVKWAVDGTCDGDVDTFIDWTAGANDCDDNNGAIIPSCDITGMSTAYAGNTVTDSSAVWPINIFAGRSISYHVTQVSCVWLPVLTCTSTEHYSTRTVVGNTAKTITVDSTWDFLFGYTPKEYAITLD